MAFPYKWPRTITIISGAEKLVSFKTADGKKSNAERIFFRVEAPIGVDSTLVYDTAVAPGTSDCTTSPGGFTRPGENAIPLDVLAAEIRFLNKPTGLPGGVAGAMVIWFEAASRLDISGTTVT